MKIGLTGGIGCGKSTAGAIFENMGVARLDTDEVAHRLMADDAATQRAIVESFGERVIRDGAIDRPRLGEIVFADEERLRELEAILHPRVRERWQAFLESSDPGLKLVEIPLLFEKKLAFAFDWVVCVSATPTTQRKRLLSRGLSDEAIRRRSSRQFSLREKVSLADYVLMNDGSTEFLQRQIAGLLSEWRRLDDHDGPD